MTEKEIHAVLCKAPDDVKMKLAINCQLNGVTVQDVERSLSNTLTVLQEFTGQAIEGYKYLEGGKHE